MILGLDVAAGQVRLPTILSLPWQAPQVASILTKFVFDAGSLGRLMSCVPWQSWQVAAAVLPSLTALPCAVVV